MATSAVQICNSALLKLGAERIISLDDDNDRARIVKEQYPKMRDEVLISHPWNFAIKRASLAQIETDPLFDFDAQFQLPTDCLRVLTTDIPADSEFSIEGRYLLCDESSVMIRYIYQVIDTTIFSKAFEEALAMRLASDVAFAITQKVNLAEQMYTLYERFMAKARSYDAQEGRSYNRVGAVEWINARFR